MKFKYLVLVSLILAILTIGAVSAADDSNALAVSDDAGDAISQADNVGLIADGDDPDDGGDDTGDDEPEDTRDDVNKNVYIPEGDISTGNDYSSIDVHIYNDDITGNITVKIIGDDDEETLIYNEKIIPYTDGYYDEEDNYIDSTGGNSILIKDLNLKPGVYNLAVGYAGDENYLPFTEYGTINYYFIKVSVDDEITPGGFYIDLASDATGNIELFIDGKSYLNTTAEDVYEEGIYLSDLSYSHHTYKLIYSDDDKYALDEAIEGEFNLTYRFGAYAQFGENEISVGESVVFEIYYPSDADGEVIITYNGKTLSKKIVANEDDEGYTSIDLSDFNLGENNITFTYKDDKYPEKSLIRTVYVNPVLSVGSQIRYANEEDAIYIILPSNATGNLVISKKGERNDSIADYNKEVIATVALVNGKANYTLKSLGLGYHDINVAYDGDDYADYFENDEFYIQIVPNIEYNENIYAGDENTITVVLPDDGDDNLTITVRSSEWDAELEKYTYENETYNAVSNGTVIIPLPKLEAGSYYIDVSYGAFSDSYWINVNANAPEFELNVDFPSEITSDNYSITVKNIPEDANGHLDLYIDGILYEEYIWLNDDSVYDLDYDKIGNHTWEIKFVGDSYYKETSKSGTFFIDWIDIPEVMDIDDEIEVELDGKEGDIQFNVDGKLYNRVPLKDGSAIIPLNKLSIGTHTYEISYYDNSNKKQLTKSGSFNVTYELGTNIDEEYSYGLVKEFKLYVFVPEDATGKVSVNVDGKVYTATPVNGSAEITLTDLIIGQNNITVSLTGDNKYSAKEIKEVLNINGYAISDEYSEENGFESVSIYLPGGNGTLELYNAVYDDEEGWIISGDVIKSAELKDGFAVINASEFKIGVYNLIAKYVSENDDNEIEPIDLHFTILPEVNITYDIVIGENATISIDMDDATGKLHIYVDDKLFETIESNNGKFQTNLTNLKLGTHCITFEYEGDDIENPFVILNDEDGPIEYFINVNPKNITVPEKFNSDGSGVITLELPEGYKGNVSVYEVIYDDEGEDILKPIIENVTYTSDNKSVSISGLSTGDHKLLLKYADDENGVFEKETTVTVPKPDAGSTVNIPDTISGDSFDVVLPKDATGGVLVTIDGETTYIPLVNGTAKIDLSKLADGAHTVSVSYAGDGNYSGFEKSANITINRPVDPKITASNLNVLYTAGTKYTVTIYGTDGKVAANTDVTFLINGKVFKTVKTNAKGIASVKITQKPGNYKITTKALGKSVVKTLKVNHIVKLQKVKVKRSAKKLVIKVTLSKVNKKYLKGKKITLKFKGKKYTAKTNKKGVAKFTIKKNVLKKLKKGKKVTYQATYLKDTVKQTVKVKK